MQKGSSGEPILSYRYSSRIIETRPTCGLVCHFEGMANPFAFHYMYHSEFGFILFKTLTFRTACVLWFLPYDCLQERSGKERKENDICFSLIDFRSIERGFACCPFDPSLDWSIELPPGRGVRILCDWIGQDATP